MATKCMDALVSAANFWLMAQSSQCSTACVGLQLGTMLGIRSSKLDKISPINTTTMGFTNTSTIFEKADSTDTFIRLP